MRTSSRRKGVARVDMNESTVRFRLDRLTSKKTGKLKKGIVPWNELGTQQRRYYRILEREENERLNKERDIQDSDTLQDMHGKRTGMGEQSEDSSDTCCRSEDIWSRCD